MLGDWIDQKNEYIQINVSQSKGKLWLTIGGNKYEASPNKDIYIVEIKNKKHPLFYNELDRVLSFNNIFYIRQSESLKNAFVGKWSSANKDESLVFDIKLENEILIWDIRKNQQEPVTYYPKKTKEGFTFTYDNQQLFFTILEDCIIDSKGRKFCKS